MISERVTGVRVIRTVVRAEAEAVAALHARARATYYPDGVPQDGTDWRAAWRGAIGRTDGQVLCAVEDGRIVGLASFRDAGAGTVDLLQLHVDPDRWRCGIGTALHTACLEQWRADGKRAAALSVHVGNRRARAFYDRHGWVPDPGRPVTEGDHHLALRLELTGE
ncbi:N-acetyltransferase family protein [Streptomyces sp. enrichment culture]|uniref:GNAT family N-acetyltransferase n=1 Tax=Streptomyces sp. enrichment culture TaxID=1795815 RepID=UPI003F55E95B